MSIDRSRSHYGFSRMAFGKDLAPGMLHAQDESEGADGLRPMLGGSF